MAEPPPGSPANPIPLPKSKKLLERYYAGKRLSLPLAARWNPGDRGKGRPGRDGYSWSVIPLLSGLS